MVDTFAHGMWSFIILRKLTPRKDIWLAILFGVMPDLLSWTIYLLYRLVSGGFGFGPPNLASIPNWAFVLYGLTHSVVVFAAVAGILYFALGKLPVYIWAWLVHIAIDIPTHSREFLPTPFLWPISDYAFPGISWGHPAILALNWGGIIVFLIYIFFFEKKA